MLNPLNFFSKLIKSNNQRELDRIAKIVNKINSLEEEIKNLKDEDFPKKTIEFKEKIKKGEKIEQILPEAFALVREASRRKRGERHFDVQLVGGIVLQESKIAEMKTGEGKTLTITLAAYLNALHEKGVHIVTVNDYLAKRDSQEMGEIYNFLGLTSGYINNDQDDSQRKQNYNCDITYATNSELGFDYLRDNMKFSKGEMEANTLLEPFLLPVTKIIETCSLAEIFPIVRDYNPFLLVVDEHGGTEGLITAADLNGEIVGEEMLNNRIYSDMRMLDNFSKKWSIAGKSEIIEINKKLGCSIPEGTDYHTLAGFMLEKFQMVPKIGDVLDFNNIKFEVISMSGPKIDRVKIILPKS